MPSAGHALVVFVLVLAVFAPQDAPQAPEVASRPPDRIAFDRVRSDATIDASGVTGLAVTGAAVWLIHRESGKVSRIDPETSTVTGEVVPGEWPCAGTVEAFGSLWVPLCGEYGMARIDPEKTTLSTTMATGIADGDQVIAAGVGSIWMLTSEAGTLARIDPDTNTPVAEIYVAPGSRALAFGHDALWVASEAGDVVARVNPYNHVIIESIAVGKAPRQLAIGEGAVWTLNGGDGTVSRIDPKANKVSATIPVGEAASKGHIAVGEGSVWISAPGAPLVRIDPANNRVAQVFTGEAGGLIAVGHTSLWLLATPDTLLRIDPRFVAALR